MVAANKKSASITTSFIISSSLLLLIGLTFPYGNVESQLLLLIIGASILLTTILWIVDLITRSKKFSVAFCLIDYLVIGAVSLATSGAASPYLALLLLPALAAIYNQSTTTIAAKLLIGGAVTTGLIVMVFGPREPTSALNTWQAGAVYIGMLVISTFILRNSRPNQDKATAVTATESQPEVERSQLNTLINSMAEAFLAIDGNRRVVLHNPAAVKILHSKAIVGEELKTVLPVMNSLKEIVDLGRLIDNTGNETIERNDLILVHDDASSVVLDFSISPVQNGLDVRGSTNPITHIIVIRDVTERKNLEEQREEFLSVISHELRTPIATAEADLSVLLNPKMAQLDERSLHYATVAHDQVVFLSEILNDITSLSRLEKDSFRTKPEPFNAVQFTEALRDEYTPIIAEKNLLFRCVISENLPVVITNTNEVKEILSNLLNNSVKYTKEGTITLSVEGSHKSRPGLLFMVQDNGIGIAKTDLEHVFEKFYRSEDYRTRESGGTGLGLYLCARLAERMKASLWVESELSRGSRFYLFIPQQSNKPPSISEFLSS